MGASVLQPSRSRALHLIMEQSKDHKKTYYPFQVATAVVSPRVIGSVQNEIPRRTLWHSYAGSHTREMTPEHALSGDQSPPAASSPIPGSLPEIERGKGRRAPRQERPNRGGDFIPVDVKLGEAA